LRPTAGGVNQEPTASPVVVVTPPTQVIAIKGTNSTGGVIGKEEEAGRGRLSVGVIAGIIGAVGLILLVAALVTKKVATRSAVPVA
jgi:hypothetical protein